MLDDDELDQRVLMLCAELSYELRHGRDPEPVMRRRLRSSYDAGYRAALEEAKRRIERRELKDQTLLASAIYTELDLLADDLGGSDGEE